MTKKEVIQILAILKAAYPNSYKYNSDMEAAGTVNIWFSEFAPFPADIILLAVQKHIGNSSFPPSIYEVKRKIQSLHWEAYEIINNTLPETASYKKAKRIYDLTRDYRMSIPEKPLFEIISGENEEMLLLE